MLATVLKTQIATQVTIQIMDAFVEMRKYINNTIIEQNYINKLVIKGHERINLLEESFNKLEEKTKRNSLFFEGQIYDVYSLLIDILNKSNLLLSFSKLTYPHGLFRLILLEQIYRSFKILNNESYHK